LASIISKGSSALEIRWDISELGSGPPPETVVCPIDGAEMVLVPKGQFTMGITPEELRHIFMLEYYIDRYPVTNYQYGKFLEETGHREPYLWNHPLWRKPMQPVVFVGWDDARAYAKWSGKSLPTEAQWEKAGRGTDRRSWAWGNEFLLGRCNSRELGLGNTSEIGLFHTGMSPYGCYDMCGNVWEMCEGQWEGSSSPMRGGCFLGSATFVRVTCRWSPEDPINGAPWLGFRCIKEIPA